MIKLQTKIDEFRQLIKLANTDKDLYMVNTKNGLVCSFNEEDILTYLGHGIWDLKPYKAAKSEDDDNPW